MSGQEGQAAGVERVAGPGLPLGADLRHRPWGWPGGRVGRQRWDQCCAVLCCGGQCSARAMSTTRTTAPQQSDAGTGDHKTPKSEPPASANNYLVASYRGKPNRESGGAGQELEGFLKAKL